MSYESDYEDVQNELHSMRRGNQDAALAIWLVLPVAFLANALALTLIIWLVDLIFGSTTTVVGIVCASYACAVLGWAVNRVQQRVIQMSLHATSIHDEVLSIKDLIEIEQKRSTRWR